MSTAHSCCYQTYLTKFPLTLLIGCFECYKSTSFEVFHFFFFLTALTTLKYSILQMQEKVSLTMKVISLKSHSTVYEKM